jgi:hypothetical protein
VGEIYLVACCRAKFWRDPKSPWPEPESLNACGGQVRPLLLSYYYRTVLFSTAQEGDSATSSLQVALAVHCSGSAALPVPVALALALAAHTLARSRLHQIKLSNWSNLAALYLLLRTREAWCEAGP